jgi:hypothetical protein
VEIGTFDFQGLWKSRRGFFPVGKNLRQLENTGTDSVIAVAAIRNSVAMMATIGFTLAAFTWVAASEIVRSR